MFLVGRSVISFLASFHSLLGQFGLLTLGGFMSDAFFFSAFVYGRAFFFCFLFRALPCTPQDQEVGGKDGKIDAGVDSVPGDGSDMGIS